MSCADSAQPNGSVPVPMGTPTVRSVAQATQHERASAAAVRAASAALAGDDRSAFLAAWQADPQSQSRAGVLLRALTLLHAAPFDATLTPGSLRGGARSWTVDATVTWSMPELRPREAHSRVRMGFVSRVGGGASLTSVTTAPGAASPVWLLPGLQVARGPRTAVVSADPRLTARVAALLQTAVLDVASVLTSWRGSLVAIVPATPAQFMALTGGTSTGDRGIAALTTTADGTRSPGAPDVVVVNPTVFATLGPVGAHVVISHEATHDATQAAVVSMPTWLAEGFADYVGIGAAHLPLSSAAARAIAEARQLGVPQSLPGTAAFDGSGVRLEAAYEGAWLAARLIAVTYGQPRLVALYRAVEARPGSLASAFQTVLHTTLGAFTLRWRAELAGLARAG